MTISSLTGISQSSAVTSTTYRPTTTTDATPPTGDTTTMSKFGDMMKQLQSLEQSDPAKAKQVLQTIASKLTDAANSATGDQATHLKELAAKFSNAADTGDLSKLAPPKAGGGHHHHHHAQAATASAPTTDGSSATSATDKYKAHSADMQQVESIIGDAIDAAG